MENFVCVKEYLNRQEAEFVRSILKGKGIEAVVSADDFGGMRPHLTMGKAARLLVAPQDLQRAIEIIKTLDSVKSETKARTKSYVPTFILVAILIGSAFFLGREVYRRLHEVKKEHYQDGALKAEWIYSNDRLHGLSKGYYKDGSLQFETPYKFGTANGFSKTYYANGRPATEFYLLNGKVEGVKKPIMKMDRFGLRKIIKRIN